MTIDLQTRALEFGQEVQVLLDAVLPSHDGANPDLRQVRVSDSDPAYVVELGTAAGGKAQTVPLLHDGRLTGAELFVQLRLVADHADSYLAVQKSKFELRYQRLPLVRLDFQRDMHTVPACHWNVHADRALVTKLLIQRDPEHSGELAKVHLPVGGPRMRPALEDFLHMLITQFGFDSGPSAKEAIDDGRLRWRRRQLATMIRDDLDETLSILRDKLGYDVIPREGCYVSEPKLSKLLAW